MVKYLIIFLFAFTSVFGQTRIYNHNIESKGWIQFTDTLKADFSIQDYYIASRSGDRLSFIASDSNNIIDMFGGDGDGLEEIIWNLWGKGTPTDITQAHWLRLWYNLANDEYCITTKQTGAQAYRELLISADGSNDQFRLSNTGNVSFGDTITSGVWRGTEIDTATFARTSGVIEKSLWLNSQMAETLGSSNRSYLTVTGTYFIGFGGTELEVDNSAWSFQVPEDYSSGGRIDIYFVTAATTDSVQFEMDVTIAAPGETTSTATEAIAPMNSVGSPASWDMKTIQDFVITSTIEAGDIIVLRIIRDASDAPDTYTGEAYINMIKFEYNY